MLQITFIVIYFLYSSLDPGLLIMFNLCRGGEVGGYVCVCVTL